MKILNEIYVIRDHKTGLFRTRWDGWDSKNARLWTSIGNVRRYITRMTGGYWSKVTVDSWEICTIDLIVTSSIPMEKFQRHSMASYEENEL